MRSVLEARARPSGASRGSLWQHGRSRAPDLFTQPQVGVLCSGCDLLRAARTVKGRACQVAAW